MEELLSGARQIVAGQIDLWIKQGKLTWDRKIIEAAAYALEGGKATRPAMLFWSAKNSSLELNPKTFEETCAAPMLAIEMIHAYSLIHDDLPAMDNDDFRRGKPSVHKKFDEGIAVLTGDALLTGAFEVIICSDLPDDRKLFLVKEIAMGAGASGMIAGQVWDLQAEAENNLNLDLWTRIHEAKTGALFGASLAMGYLVGADKVDINHLDKIRMWGIQLGKVFQIIDDRLDKGPFYKKLGEEGLMELCHQEAKNLKEESSHIWNNKNEVEKILRFFVNRNI